MKKSKKGGRRRNKTARLKAKLKSRIKRRKSKNPNGKRQPKRAVH